MRQVLPHGLKNPRFDRSYIHMNGQDIACEQGSPWLDIYFDNSQKRYFVVDEAGHRRARFSYKSDARRWCRDASIFAAAPMTNLDIKKLHDHMTGLCWQLGRYCHGCFGWEQITKHRRIA